jgi:hypothetical protein
MSNGKQTDPQGYQFVARLVANLEFDICHLPFAISHLIFAISVRRLSDG